jgi:LacI family transcriptional regulator
MAQKALEDTPKPTALFAANNFVAIGALRALKEGNYRIPEDIAVVAFDDIPLTFTIEPFLTVATQPAREMGKQAVRLLLARIKGDAERPSQEIILPTGMIVRSSSGELD